MHDCNLDTKKFIPPFFKHNEVQVEKFLLPSHDKAPITLTKTYIFNKHHFENTSMHDLANFVKSQFYFFSPLIISFYYLIFKGALLLLTQFPCVTTIPLTEK
jgi:hypothetical protein